MKSQNKSERSSSFLKRIALPLVLALSLIGGANVARAVTIGQYYIHTPGTVRDTEGGFVIGRMDAAWGHAFIKQPGADWSWGYMSGAGICGWIENIHIPNKLDNSTFGSCSTPPNPGTGIPHRQYLLSSYASEVDDYAPGNVKSFGKRVSLNPGSWQTYGNYFNGGIRHALGTITDARYVTWRYICKGSGNGYVLISHAPDSTSSGEWCFISMSAIDKATLKGVPYSGGAYPKNENGVWCNLPHDY
ncbi:MAG: hypothetical protein JWM68_317 [Verrucomicrobiales bacterium]|nr:hypothetical protein [Verrucomicrobiales bacterium]